MNPDQTHDPYHLFGRSVADGLNELLAPLVTETSPEELLKSTTVAAFCAKFLTHAGQTCSNLAHALAKETRRQATTSVRGVATSELAETIRERCFGKTDGVLERYISEHEDITRVGTAALATSDDSPEVTGAALKGALLGKLLGGEGESGTRWARIGAACSAMNEIIASAERLRTRLALFDEAERGIYHLPSRMVLEYLGEAADLPERIIDYVCSAALAQNVDFERQHRVSDEISSSITAKLSAATAFIERLVVVEEKLSQEATELQRVEQEQAQVVEQIAAEKSGRQFLRLFGAAGSISLLLFGIWGVTWPDKEMGMVFIVGGVAGLLVSWLLGFVTLTQRAGEGGTPDSNRAAWVIGAIVFFVCMGGVILIQRL